MQRQPLVIAVSLVTLLVAGGCYTREESIVIRPDGSATATYKVEGDAVDIADGGALPAGAPWVLVTESTEKGTRDRPEQSTRVWELALDDLNDFPVTLAAADVPEAALGLVTATHLVVEEMPDRTVYRFSRRYIGRRVGFLEKVREEQVSSELLARIEDEGADALTDDEQDRLFGELAEYETFAMWTRTRNAMGQAVIAGDLQPTDFEKALGTLEEALQDGLPQRLEGGYLRDFFRLDEADQDKELKRLRRDIVTEVQRHLPPASWRRVEAFIAEEERRMEVTDDLGDELFALSVEMPGTVVRSNAYIVEGGEVAWEFSGEDLRGGDLVMTAVSVLEHRTPGQ